MGSSGSQPHLSQRYCGTPAGLGLPHCGQKRPLLWLPHTQIQTFSSGFFAPHSVQNLPVFSAAPQLQAQPVRVGACV